VHPSSLSLDRRSAAAPPFRDVPEAGPEGAIHGIFRVAASLGDLANRIFLLEGIARLQGAEPLAGAGECGASLRSVRRPSFECFSGRGAVADLVLDGKAYQVNVMVGSCASARVVEQALAVGRSFELAR